MNRTNKKTSEKNPDLIKSRSEHSNSHYQKNEGKTATIENDQDSTKRIQKTEENGRRNTEGEKEHREKDASPKAAGEKTQTRKRDLNVFATAAGTQEKSGVKRADITKWKQNSNGAGRRELTCGSTQSARQSTWERVARSNGTRQPNRKGNDG